MKLNLAQPLLAFVVEKSNPRLLVKSFLPLHSDHTITQGLLNPGILQFDLEEVELQFPPPSYPPLIWVRALCQSP